MNLAWRDAAACRGKDPNEFVLDGQGTDYDRAVARAKAVCARCEVRADCLNYALSLGTKVVGVWGGTLGTERRRLLERRGAA